MDENLDKRIKNLNDLKVRIDLSRYAPPKKGGVNGEITEVRSLIWMLLSTPKKQKPEMAKPGEKKWKPPTMVMICSLTKGWTASEMYQVYRDSVEFSKNPGAAFWLNYKKFKLKYGNKIKERIRQRILCQDGKKSRKDKQEERQGLLF